MASRPNSLQTKVPTVCRSLYDDHNRHVDNSAPPFDGTAVAVGCITVFNRLTGFANIGFLGRSPVRGRSGVRPLLSFPGTKRATHQPPAPVRTAGWPFGPGAQSSGAACSRWGRLFSAVAGICSMIAPPLPRFHFLTIIRPTRASTFERER